MLKVHKGIVSDLLHAFHWCNGRECLFEVCLGGAEHEVANIDHFHLGGERKGRVHEWEWIGKVR